MSYGSFKIYFGKHNGKTLDEIYAIDKRYLKWIQREFKPGTVLNAVQKFLNDDPNLELNFDETETQELSEFNYDETEPNVPEDWDNYGIPDDISYDKEQSEDLWEPPVNYNGEDIPF